MIFITVGTHEQQFNRLIKFVDELKKNKMISEDVIMQTGFSTYNPQYCECQKFFSFEDMNRFIKSARIVITHGGPSSFIAVLQIGKIPVVVPRQKQFDEHVNDHQMEFCRFVAERQKNIILVEDIEKLKMAIFDYDNVVSHISTEMKSNNRKFNEEFEKIVERLVKKK